MNTRKDIKKIIKAALSELKIDCLEIELETPKDPSNGDYSSNIAMKAYRLIASSQTGKLNKVYASPLELAKEIGKRIKKNHLIEKIEVVEPGFINFYLSQDYFSNWINGLLEGREKVLNKPKSSKGKVIVEYSSPNIAKPFTVGHLRSTIIGDGIANLLEAVGWEVFRDNHIGDWGSQFGKQIYAIKTWGDEEKIESADSPVKELVALYVRFHKEAEIDPVLEDKAREWFKKLEKGDSEARRLWQKCVDWSWKEFDRLYLDLGIKFTENNGKGYGEAFFEDKMKPIIDELREKKFLKKDEGAELIYFPSDKYPPLMILKQDGTTLYATRDLATDKFRLEKYGKDIKIINETGTEQSLYFNQLFEAEKMLGWTDDYQRIHVRHGLYRFKDQKMSTRKGNVVFLEDLLNEAEIKVKNLTKTAGNVSSIENSRIIAIGALKWNDLKRNSVQDIIFNWEDVLNMQGDSGPYMQYTYVRTQSILKKVGNSSLSQISFSKLKEVEEVDLIRYLSRYFDIVEQAADSFSPNILCNYLFILAQKFNLFYQKHKVIGVENEKERLELVTGTGIILEHGLSLLGIKTLKKM
ncbi:MAG: arginine--tRNA ligase [Candidatus Levyibacteriota bacterium]